MSRDRGVRLQNALAAYLRRWWPSAESAGSGRPGSDVLGTPGIVWENKTGAEFRPWEWAGQANRHRQAAGDLPVVVYWPRAVGAQRPQNALAIVQLGDLCALLGREMGLEHAGKLLAERIEALEQAEMAARDALTERTSR